MLSRHVLAQIPPVPLSWETPIAMAPKPTAAAAKAAEKASKASTAADEPADSRKPVAKRQREGEDEQTTPKRQNTSAPTSAKRQHEKDDEQTSPKRSRTTESSAVEVQPTQPKGQEANAYSLAPEFFNAKEDKHRTSQT